jgi:multicomponent Na+:H+ antiporter subunit G
MLLGVALRLRTADDITTLILVGLFQTWTVPVAAHMIARAARR